MRAAAPADDFHVRRHDLRARALEEGAASTYAFLVASTTGDARAWAVLSWAGVAGFAAHFGGARGRRLVLVATATTVHTNDLARQLQREVNALTDPVPLWRDAIMLIAFTGSSRNRDAETWSQQWVIFAHESDRLRRYNANVLGSKKLFELCRLHLVSSCQHLAIGSEPVSLRKTVRNCRSTRAAPKRSSSGPYNNWPAAMPTK